MKFMELKGTAAENQWLEDEVPFLGGGFKYFLFSPLFGEMIQFD